MSGSERPWDDRYSSPEWGTAVVEALRALFNEDSSDNQIQNVIFIRADLERHADGVAFLRAIYDHADHERRIGVRRQLDGRGPLAEMQGVTLAESLAYDIAHYGMAEPLGSYWNLLVEDESGTWWWGDGYPGETP